MEQNWIEDGWLELIIPEYGKSNCIIKISEHNFGEEEERDHWTC